MKKRITTSLVATSLLFLTGTGSVFAEEATSSADISFTGTDTSATAPSNPDNPDNPGGEPGTGMGGPLSLDYVPVMNFGNQGITGRVETYELLNLKPYIQVTDKRGTGVGWKVTASLSSFVNTEQSKSFDGVLTFKNANVLTTTGNTSVAPSASNVTLTSRQTGEKIFVAQPNQGLGTWLTRWYPDESTVTNDSVTLTVNTANVTTGSYTAEIEWVISNAP